MGVPALKENNEIEKNKKDKKSKKSGFFISIPIKELGKPNSLRYTVLSNIIGEQYDSAIRDLEDFLRGDSEYPNFHERIHRFVNHSIDLVYAIKTKRNFAGINSLTRAKQQELFSKFKHHFYELQYMLKKIEKIQKDLKIEDVRSTIYVVKASWYATVSIAIVAVLLEIFGGLAITFSIVSDDFSTDLVSWMFSFF